MIKKLLCIGLLSAFIMPGFVMAAPSQTRANYPHFDNQSLKEDLNLSQEQKEKANALRKEAQKKIRPYRDELRIMRAAYGEMNPNTSRAKRLRAEMDAMQQKIEVIQIENERAFMQILTSAQKSKYNKLKEDRKRRYENYLNRR